MNSAIGLWLSTICQSIDSDLVNKPFLKQVMDYYESVVEFSVRVGGRMKRLASLEFFVQQEMTQKRSLPNP